MSAIGFTAYTTYVFIKNLHFKDNNFNIMNISGIPLHNKLLNSWNNKRRKKDGLKFKSIEEECSNIKQLALLYASYYVENPNFYIQDIFEDDFETYKNNKIILENLKECFTNDLKSVILTSKEEQISPKKLFIADNSLPRIFKMGYSINTLCIMDNLFKILELNKNVAINSLEEGGWENVKLSIKNYKPIIKSYLDKHNWKAITKEILKK